MPFWTYMLHCRDRTFYVGHTDDLDIRVAQHQAGTFGGYTARKRPVTLVWSAEFPTRDEALAAEQQIKGWRREKKLALIRGDWNAISELAKGRKGGLRQAQAKRLRVTFAVQPSRSRRCCILTWPTFPLSRSRLR